MDEKVIGHNIEGYTAEVHLKETGGFISTVACESLVAPRDVLACDHVRFVRALVRCHFVDFSGARRNREVLPVVSAVVPRRPGGMETGNPGRDGRCQTDEALAAV